MCGSPTDFEAWCQPDGLDRRIIEDENGRRRGHVFGAVCPFRDCPENLESADAAVCRMVVFYEGRPSLRRNVHPADGRCGGVRVVALER